MRVLYQTVDELESIQDVDFIKESDCPPPYIERPVRERINGLPLVTQMNPQTDMRTRLYKFIGHTNDRIVQTPIYREVSA